MTPDAFIAKWSASALKESAGAQSHFNDLCTLLDEPAPADADPEGTWFCFERGATKTGGGDGWADVWKRGHFAWEYKGKKKDLRAAFKQLQQYALALENPPLLVVSDMETVQIHTNWTNTVHEVYELTLDDLRDWRKRRWLKWVLADPEQLKPGRTRQGLTEDAAGEFAGLAKRLRDKGHAPQTVAHFVNRLVFCMFAEDVELLPDQMFTKMLRAARARPDKFQAFAQRLFGAMKDGGILDFQDIEWFNGGLFDDDTALPLTRNEIDIVLRAADRDWDEIDPSIFGTLFERGLDPDKRSQLGAHYTDRDKIMLLVEPVVVRPWERDWAGTRDKIADAAARRDAAKSQAQRTKHQNAAQQLYDDFLARLRAFRVLDPACGSGNFLFIALQELKNLEHRAGLEAEAHGVAREFPALGPEAVKGIEINPYAAELARVTVWIGEIQWMQRNGFSPTRQPILKPLDTIACRDAVLNADGGEPDWPEADVVIGNPPFLGGRQIRDILGDSYVEGLFRLYRERVPAEADLVTYWFAKAWDRVAIGRVRRAGLVATNSIRGGANRRVLKPIARAGGIYEAWDDEPWVVEGAAVRVAIVCFAAAAEGRTPHLDGAPVDAIHVDLSAGAVDVTRAKRLPENIGRCFQGVKFSGPFTIDQSTARQLLLETTNPNGRPNSDVLRLWCNGLDILDRPQRRWCIDFGYSISERESALYEKPFHHLKELYKQENDRRTQAGQRILRERDSKARSFWWIYQWPREGMRRKLSGLYRFIATPEVSKHRIFCFFDKAYITSGSIYAITADDDVTFGILHSRFHERWALRMGTSLEDRPRYTPSTTFETFPFPPGLTPPDLPVDEAANPLARAIGEAARRLNELRENWLNPPDLVRREPEVVPGYPDRLVPVSDKAAKDLKKRTLTKLYNECPQWLADAHADLDAAVAAAYGWPTDIRDEDALARLMAINQTRSNAA